jgi:hypothetical protein
LPESGQRPAYYSARPGGWRDWWSILHPPYTAWHLSYVVIGACLAPDIDGVRLLATVLAFFAAVGVAAHALDERNCHPLRTHIPDATLMAVAGAGLVAAVALGIAGVSRVGWVLLPFIVVGPILVVSYNLELFGGRVHSDVGFAVAWGAFPLLTGYVAQAGRLDVAAVIGAFGAFGLSYAQRTLSTPARLIRRHVTRLDGEVRLDDGTLRRLDSTTLLAPLEGALRWLSWSTVALALALAVTRLT